MDYLMDQSEWEKEEADTEERFPFMERLSGTFVETELMLMELILND